MSTQTLDYDTLTSAAGADLVAAQSTHLPAVRRQELGTVKVQAGFASDLAAMVGQFVPLGLGRPDISELLAEAKQIGTRMGTDAYYSFPAGGSRIEGGTIRLAEELSQLWGHLLTGVRIDNIEGSRVWLTGLAGDALTGRMHAEQRVYALPPAPAKFADKADQVQRWESMQIGSAGSKALRTAIFRLVPRRLVAEAVEAAKAAKMPPNVDFQKLLDALVEMYAKSKSAITLAELEQVVGVQRPQWKVGEWRVLDDLLRALRSGETNVDEVWPNRRPMPSAAPTPAALPAVEPAAPPPLPELTPTSTALGARPAPLPLRSREPGEDG